MVRGVGFGEVFKKKVSAVHELNSCHANHSYLSDQSKVTVSHSPVVTEV